jgi:hypothetical protein
MKIYDYTSNKYINEEDIKSGMQLRIEGTISEVEGLLKQVNYEIIAEGHETENNKRVYIKVLSTEIQVREYMTNKEFKETIRRDESFCAINGVEFETLKLRTVIWHSDGIFGEISLVNEDDETLLDIAFIDGLNLKGERLYQTLDNKENTINILKYIKKLLTKYKKWCENFDIKINNIKEETC